MPSLDKSQPLVKAGAITQTEWGSADAETEVKFIGTAKLKRGIDLGIGIGAFASANAGLSKFIAAQVGGDAFAKAQVRLVAHTPLNLFDKCGVEAAVEAIAEAAAGVSVEVGLKVGDFIKLAEDIVGDKGLAIDLIVLLLEETKVSIKAQARAAAAAKAHAAISLLVTLTGKDPSFRVKGEAGVGLAAGAGFGFQAGFRFANFRRYFSRAVDKSINTSIGDIQSKIPKTNNNLKNLLTVLSPVSKTMLRLSYEVADMLSKESHIAPGNNENVVAQKAVQIIIEEIQRFLFQTILQTGIKTIQSHLGVNSTFKNAAWWPQTASLRTDISQALINYPTDPFFQDGTNYIVSLLENLSNLFGQLSNDQTSEELKKYIASLFSTTLLSQYLIEKKLIKKEAYAMAIGAGTVRATPEPGFTGNIPVTADPSLVTYINSQIQKPVSSKLTYPNLVSYLITDHVLDPILELNPSLTELHKMFETELGTPKRMIATFLESGSTLLIDNKVSEQDVLKVLLTAMDHFVERRIKVDLIPFVSPYLPDEISRQFFEEVIIGTLYYMKGEIFSALLDWKKIKFTREEILEALSGVLMILLGRTFTVTADVLFNTIMKQVSMDLLNFSKDLQPDGKLIKHFGLQQNPSAVKMMQVGFEAASIALKPIEDNQRRRIRNHLFNILQPIPLKERSDFLKSLQQDNFIPDLESVNGLTHELKELVIDRLGRFLDSFIQITSGLVNEAIEELIAKAIELINAWKNKMEDVLEELAEVLRRIETEIKAIQKSIDDAMNNAFDETTRLLRQVKNGAFDLARKTLINNMFKQVEDWANDIKITNNDWTPFIDEGKIFKEARKAFLNAAKDTIKNGLRSLNAIEGFFDDILDIGTDVKNRIRRVDLKRNIEAQVSTIFLDVLDGKLKEKLGKNFGFKVEVGFAGFSVKVGLSQKEIIKSIRSSISNWENFTDGVHLISVKLQVAGQNAIQLNLQQIKKLNADSYKKSVAKIKSEQLDSSTKLIKIISPKEGELYHNEFKAEIQLSGISKSYLGMGKDEQQQIFVHINGKLTRFKQGDLQITEKVDNTINTITLKFSILKAQLTPNLNTIVVSIGKASGGKTQKQSHFLFNASPNKNQNSVKLFSNLIDLKSTVKADKTYLEKEADKNFREPFKF